MKNETNQFPEYCSRAYAGIDPDFDTHYAENYEAPKMGKFQKDIFEVIEALN